MDKDKEADKRAKQDAFEKGLRQELIDKGIIKPEPEEVKQPKAKSPTPKK